MALFRVMMIGDVVGQAGCEHVRRVLPPFKRERGVDLVIANGENSAEGNGLLPSSARHLYDSGVDVITTGNHALRRRESYELYQSGGPLLRPANFHPSAPGQGYYLYDALRFEVCILNLQGLTYMSPNANPFETADLLLREHPARITIVDFHAEATSEKIAMGHYLDGRVSLVAGTHTHVPTADERILPGGTGYITDLGMVGGLNSILGVKQQPVIQRFITGLPVRFENDKEDCQLCGILAEIDAETGKTTKIERILLK